jgi:hypothetical protein
MLHGVRLGREMLIYTIELLPQRWDMHVVSPVMLMVIQRTEPPTMPDPAWPCLPDLNT